MSTDSGYFIMLRYPSGCMFPVDDDNDGESDNASVALFESEEQAQEWIDNSGACRSGQVAAQIYEAP